MQFKYKPAYGLSLYICSNDPELCSFMTNDIKGGKMQIMKCDQCMDGYLIVKKKKDNYFLGCTNYREDGSGCNNSVSPKRYDEIKAFSPSYIISDGKMNKNKNLNIETANDKTSKHYCLESDIISDLEKAIKIVLSCVFKISQKKYLGVMKISSILKGTLPKGYEKTNYNKISEFGAFSKLEERDIVALILALVDERLLLQTKSQYPVIHPTIEAEAFLKDGTDTRTLLKAIGAKYKKIRNERII